MGPAVAAVRHFGEFEYAAGSWPQAFRVLVKAEALAGSDVTPAKDNQRYVVTTLRSPSPQSLYQQDYCACGQAENLIKQVKVDLKSDRLLDEVLAIARRRAPSVVISDFRLRGTETSACAVRKLAYRPSSLRYGRSSG